MSSFLDDQASLHQKTVKEHHDKCEAARLAAEAAERQRIADKQRRKEERAAARKAAEIQALREQIQADYIAKAVPVEGIVFNDIVDADGFGCADKPQVCVLGGFLGQFMMVLNTIVKHYARLDVPTPKSQGSSRRVPSERPMSQHSDAAASQGVRSAEGPHRRILDARVVQTFLYSYILEKLKVERLAIQVDDAYEKFLNALKVPMQLNEMRTMKEPNYSDLRALISLTKQGSVLKCMHDNAEALGLDPEVFELVFEGFWDVYTFHGNVPDINGKKMLQWIPKVNLIVNETTAKAAEPAEDGEEDRPATGEDGQEKLSAVVRIRIPYKKPEPEEDEEGNLVEKEVPEEELEEQPIEDKCHSIVTRHNGQKLLCLNQAAARTLRQELIKEFQVSCEALHTLDINEFTDKMEQEAERIESEFVGLFRDDPENKSDCPRVPIFDYRPEF